MYIWILLGAGALMVLGAVQVGLMIGVRPDAETLHYFSPDFLQRALEYERVSLTCYLAGQVLNAAVFGAASLLFLRYLGADYRPSLKEAAGYILLFLLFLNLITLPLDFYRGFVVEHRFLLSNQTVGSWFGDYIKSMIISLSINTVGLTALYLIFTHWPQRWWVLAGIGFSLFLLLGTYLYPVIVDPLFHNFTPLKDEAMSVEIVDMADRAGIEVDEILVADASRRTHKANAYFTGLGRTKRIVLYDTLVKSFTPEEVMVVIAHEMGHWRYNHIVKNILMSIIGTFLSLYLLKVLLDLMGVTGGLSIIPLALLFFLLLSMISMPFQNGISRVFERQADQEALSLTHDSASFVTLKQKLAEANISTVKPHPLVKLVLYSHPPVIERIQAAKQ
ncbi:M48 family metallopeptidase [Candidatus Contubernalis alkaliaceticus]|uniref:M48 family metallopeptidase n=1 Tax=Candidatus Contubernalis alkaliaceticus TaxID=338645 RepID=UPI001F4C0698|nr:M48 family metallopeptidase [Candidatus Contubernalis alkalaceticus]